MKKLKLSFRKKLKRVRYYFVDIILYFILAILTLSFAKVMLWVDLALLVIYLIFTFYRLYTRSKIGSLMKNNNVHIFGYRRSGKDLATQNYIQWRFSKKYKKICRKLAKNGQDHISYFQNNPLYLSLTDYGYGGLVVDLKEFELIDVTTNKYITYDDFINGNSVLSRKNDKFEGLDLILSEAQLSLPNTEHNTLDKKYPWLPVFIALAGHLYNMNIIINSQEFERPWVKIRNQQDLYMRCLKTFPQRKGFISRVRPYIPFFRKYLITRVRVYETRESATTNKLAFDGKSLLTDISKDAYLTAGQSTKEVYEATNGKIREYYLFTNIDIIKYDTREYHQRIFGEKAP